MDEIVGSILTAAGGAAISSVFKGPAETFSQLRYYNFGYKMDIKVRQRKQEVENLFLKDIGTEVSNIPIDQIQEPKLSILGPALEASKYYIDDEELRSLFAKLIAASMDNSKNEVLQPAFVEIIKQMSPIDAKNLINLYDIKDKQNPIVSIILESKDSKNYKEVFDHFYIENIGNISHVRVASSLLNLKRLGLIEINYGVFLSDENKYLPYENHPIINQFKNEYNDDLHSIELKKGLIKITNFGMDFCKICI
ncbi:DUF4393 domain-containing protein [Gemella sp. 27098_8_149]|uniref:DUF4393 domain-containing protein n=1 Tax=Gemella sp. 27098_8_149 TaxID=3003689 RepID=UPI00352DAAF4